MDLFFLKKQNTETEDELKIRASDLFIKPKKEKRPAKAYGLIFILLCTIAAAVLLVSDNEPAEEDERQVAVVMPVEGVREELPDQMPDMPPEEPSEEVREETVIPDYNQQPGQAKIEYRRYEINNVIYEIRNDAAFVVGTVGNTKNIRYLTIASSIRYMYPVVEIGPEAFSGCGRLLRLHIPDSVLIIREGAFENCSKLEQVRMSESLITIEDRVFAGCVALKSLRFPATVRELSADVFEGASSLSSLKIPAGCRIPEGEDPFGLGLKLKIDVY